MGLEGRCCVYEGQECQGRGRYEGLEVSSRCRDGQGVDVKTRLLSISLTFYFQELTIDGYGGVFTLHWALEGNNEVE